MKKLNISLAVACAFLIAACGIMNEKNKGKGMNLFTVEQDKTLGAQVAAEIDADTVQFPLLDSTEYADVYKYVYKVRDKILNSGQVDFKDDFDWRLRIIHDDSTMNAFCTPGGYIYIYTGILKFLESEGEFAGVLGHEIGHADMRHSTRQMSKMLGVQVLLSAVLGDQSALGQVTGALIGLKFSRKHETEADERSVKYLCPTDYNAAGGAGFFQKISDLGGDNPPEFLSTHPNPEDRIENFQTLTITNGCVGDKDYKTEFAAMVAKLPK
ncbi:MAG: M48 family metalloprotease [Crocinitomicaceae bacterium]|nr:M48 family metalloprotease [Crocinitomicaceae bacterium]